MIEHYELTFVDAASVLSRTGLYLNGHALYAIAEPLFQCALSICEQQLGAEHPDTATSLNNLATLYYAQGKYSEAEPLLQRALAIVEQQSGREHPMTQMFRENYVALRRKIEHEKKRKS